MRTLVRSLASFSPPRQAQATLYERVGGYDVIAAVTDDFLARCAQTRPSTPSETLMQWKVLMA